MSSLDTFAGRTHVSWLPHAKTTRSVSAALGPLYSDLKMEGLLRVIGLCYE